MKRIRFGRSVILDQLLKHLGKLRKKRDGLISDINKATADKPELITVADKTSAYIAATKAEVVRYQAIQKAIEVAKAIEVDSTLSKEDKKAAEAAKKEAIAKAQAQLDIWNKRRVKARRKTQIVEIANGEGRYFSNWKKLLKTVEKAAGQDIVFSQWEDKLIALNADLDIVNQDIESCERSVKAEREEIRIKQEQAKAEAILRKLQRKLERKEERNQARQQRALDAFGYRFQYMVRPEQLEGRKQELQKVIKLAQANGEAYPFAAVKELKYISTESKSLIISEAFANLNIIGKFQSLRAEFNRIQSLFIEGGECEKLAENAFDELAAKAQDFHDESKYLEYIYSIHKHLHPEDNDAVLIKIIHQLNATYDSMQQWVRDCLEQGINATWEQVSGYVNKSIFAYNQAPQLSAMKAFAPGITSSEKEAVLEQILNRISQCAIMGVDFTTLDLSMGEEKLPELAGVDHDFFESGKAFDLTYNVEEINKAKEAFEAVAAKQELQQLLRLTNWKIAGSSYKEVSTISLRTGRTGSMVVSVDHSYAPLSIVARYAKNLMIKVDNKDLSSEEVAMISEATAESLGLAMLTSAGGGRTFLTKGALRAFATISNSLVDVKAYIASLAGSACRDEWHCQVYLGVKLFVLYRDNKPFVHPQTGKIVAYINGNEGSAWYQKDPKGEDNLCKQFRAVVLKWALEYLPKVNAVQQEQIIRDDAWQKAVKTWYSSVLMFAERMAQREAYPMKRWEKVGTDVINVNFSDNYMRCQDAPISGREIYHPNSKTMCSTIEHNGEKYLLLPRLTKEALRCMPKSIRDQIGLTEESLVETANEVDSANLEKVERLLHYFSKADTIGFTQTMLRDIDSFQSDRDLHKFHSKMRDYANGAEYFEQVADIMKANEPSSFVKSIKLPHNIAVAVWDILMVSHELYSRKSRMNNVHLAFPDGRCASDFALECLDLNVDTENEEKNFIRSVFSMATLKALGSESIPTAFSIPFDIAKDKGKNKFTNSKANQGRGASWVAENFTAILINGKSFHQHKMESEMKTIYPDFEGMSSVYGFVPEGGCKTSFLGKGMLAPIDMSTFTHIDGVTIDDITGRKLDEHPRVALNPFDGADKTQYKKFLKKKAKSILEEHFHLLDIECQEDKALIDSYRANPEFSFKVHSYYLGEPEDTAIMVMRQLAKGKTQCTFQATEKMLTGMHRENPSGDYINATKDSDNSYRAYLGKFFVGGTYDRCDLPQIPKARLGEFKLNLRREGIKYEERIIESRKLAPSQKYIDQLNSTGDGTVIASREMVILDGHHRWYSNPNVNVLIVDASFEELLELAESFPYSYYNNTPAIADLMAEATEVFASLPSTDGNGNECNDFMIETSIDQEGYPLHNFINMMGALCKIKAPSLMTDIVESVKGGSDAEVAAAFLALGAGIENSATLSNKIAESVDKKLGNYVRGAVIKGMNLVAQVYDDLPDDTIMLPAQLKVMGLHKVILALIWRYPIASATSVGKIKVVYSDDPKYASNLKRYGFDLKNFPMAILLPSALKTSFQYDDDGDYFGCLQEPSWNRKDWELLIARAKNEAAAFLKGEFAETKNLMKLWKKYQAWVLISGNHLERDDYKPQNIEMADVVTDGNKKAMKIIDVRGNITEQFRKWSHRDGRGPVGLISDLFTVILASGLRGPAFTMLACVCGYILQHSIDSAKHEKLVIAAAILLNPHAWTEVNGKLELYPWVNTIVIKWNELWKDHESNRMAIQALEDTAANAMYEAHSGKLELEECYWLPSISTIEKAAYEDNSLVYYAPTTLLANMARTNPNAGGYGKYILFGKEVPVHPDFADAVDPTRYMAKHCLELTDIKSPVSGDTVGWSRISAFRKIRLRDYLETKVIWRTDEKGKLNAYVTWPQLPDAEGFSFYWNDNEDGFAGIATHSIPNSIFKPVLRWALELALGGIKGLKAARELFLEKKDGDIVTQEYNMIPAENKPDFKLPWTVGNSETLANDFAKDELAKRLFNTKQHENGIVECLYPKEYELTDKVIWGFIAWADITLTPELKKHASDGFDIKGDTLKEQYLDLAVKATAKAREEIQGTDLDLEEHCAEAVVKAQQLFLRRIRAYVLRCLIVKLSHWAYCEVSPQMYNRIKVVRESIKTASGAELINLKAELKELTRYKYDGKIFVHSPSRIQLKFEAKVNALYEDTITDKGRKADRRYQLPFGTGFNWMKVPSWYTGTAAEWRDTIFCILNDMFVTGLIRELGFSTCSYNEIFKEELETVDLYVDAEANVKVIDESKLVSFLQQANSMHVHTREDDCTIYDCESCMKSVRKFVTAQSRKAKYVRGTKEYKEHKVSESATLMAKTCIESIEAQCKQVVRKAVVDDEFFDNNPYNISRKTAMEYIKIKGSDATRVRYGFTTTSQQELFESWDKVWRSTAKETFITKIESLNHCNWFSLPVDYLVYFGQELKDWMQGDKENEFEVKSLKEFQNGDKPTPPSGGGGGGTPKPSKASSVQPKPSKPSPLQAEPVSSSKPTTVVSDAFDSVLPGRNPFSWSKENFVSKAGVDFSESQKSVFFKLMEKINRRQKHIVLAGAAGTGKTTMMVELIHQLKELAPNLGIWVGAPTAQAVKVLKSKFPCEDFVTGTGTIHSLFFSVESEEDGNVKFGVGNRAPANGFVIIDETSMMGSEDTKIYLEASRRRGLQTIYVGDFFQNNPVKDSSGVDLEGAELKLTEVFRNSGDILDFATYIRTQEERPNLEESTTMHLRGKDTDNKVNLQSICSMISSDYWTKNGKTPNRVTDDGKVIGFKAVCFSKKLVGRMNTMIRKQLGFVSDIPEVGETLTCYNNCRKGPFFVANGEELTVVSVNASHAEDLLSITLKNENGDEGTFVIAKDLSKGSVTVTAMAKKLNMAKSNLADMGYLECNFGYAITGHKAQGSEWGNVVVISDLGTQLWLSKQGKKTMKQVRQWVYTAVTRAKDTCVLCHFIAK